ncbi:MAG: hypothetical protein ACYS8Z_18775 [Planctomycetota bacterium]|jgi:hypothetical protein
MRICTITAIVVSCVLMVGCGENAKEPKPFEIDKGKVNQGLVNSFNDMAMQNAIISQHTLYPYHFVNNGTELNELGKRDLSVLAWHFRENPGGLNVRRGGASEELYNGRIEKVGALLSDEGVDPERIGITDGLPGGPGMTSEKVLTILENAAEPGTRKTTAGTYTTGSQ